MNDLKSKPETFRQAQTFDVVRNEYSREGLCNKDAAQAAWGHQNGFSSIKNPCSQCMTIKLSDEIIKRHGTRAQDWLQGRWIQPKEN